MRKSDLKTGLLVVNRAKDRYIVFGDRIIGKDEAWDRLKSYNDDLTNKVSTNLDIMEVYQIVDYYNIYGIDTMLTTTRKELLWERELKINWDVVPKWTKVLVRDSVNEGWIKRYYLGYDEEDYDYPFIATSSDEYTWEIGDDYYFSQCKLHPSVEIKDEWRK